MSSKNWEDLTEEEQEKIKKDIKEWRELKELIDWDYCWYLEDPKEYNKFVKEMEKSRWKILT